MTYDYGKAKDEALGKITKGLNESGDKQKESVNQKKDKNIKYAEEETAKKIDETTDDYLDMLDSVAIQKELDLRDIQETRANMGLSRSGLSATEQTAAILSAGNKTAEAQRNRQKAVDSLNQSLANYKIQQETEANDAILAIDAGIAEKIAEAETSLTNETNKLISSDIQAKIDAKTKQQESADKVRIAQINASGKEETDRVNALYKAKENNQISKETLSYAIVNGFSVKQAIQHEQKEESPTYKKPTDDIYQGAVRAYQKGGEVELDKYLEKYPDYDVVAIDDYVKSVKGKPLTRWAAISDGGSHSGKVDDNAVIVDIATGKRYTGKQLYDYFVKNGLTSDAARKRVQEAQKIAGVI